MMKKAAKKASKNLSKKSSKKEMQPKDCMEHMHLVLQIGGAPPMTVRFSDEEHAMHVYRGIYKLWRGRSSAAADRYYEFTNEYGSYVVDVQEVLYIAIARLSALHAMRPFQLPA